MTRTRFITPPVSLRGVRRRRTTWQSRLKSEIASGAAHPRNDGRGVAVSPRNDNAAVYEAGSRKILLIESDPLLRSFWTEVFEKEGFQVSLAEDETQARDQVRGNAPDLIFLGSNMEGMRGVQFMARMKSEQSDLLVVAPLNASALREKLERALDSGAGAPRRLVPLPLAAAGLPKIQVEGIVCAVQEALNLRAASLFGDLTITQMEHQMIKEALKRARGNQTQAARLLGISRFALRNRLKKYRLEEVPR